MRFSGFKVLVAMVLAFVFALASCPFDAGVDWRWGEGFAKDLHAQPAHPSADGLLDRLVTAGPAAGILSGDIGI